jgi:hypothetical protein
MAYKSDDDDGREAETEDEEADDQYEAEGTF